MRSGLTRRARSSPRSRPCSRTRASTSSRVDGPGFGRSPLLPAERYRLASLVAILHELVDELELDRPS